MTVVAALKKAVDLHRNIGGLLASRGGVEIFYGFPRLAVGLLLAALDEGYDVVGRLQNDLGGSVVALQAHYLRVGIVPLELEDVAQVGPPPRIDALVVVAHHAEVAMALGKQPYQPVLGRVGVLVFIHVDIREPLLVMLQDQWEELEHGNGVQQQVIEVHGVVAPQLFLVGSVNPVDHPGQVVMHLRAVAVRVDHLVLGVIDKRPHQPGRMAFGIYFHISHDLVDHAQLIVVVVNGEVALITEPLRLAAQDAGAGGVEGGDPDGAGARSSQAMDPPPHLLRRLVGEGYSQYPRGINPPGSHQQGDAVGEDAGLPAPRPSQDEKGAVQVEGRLPLLRVKFLQELLFAYHFQTIIHVP